MSVIGRISLLRADITKLGDVEAIVNAANESLLGGGGVDGQIHKIAGPQLLEECRTLSGCKTGDAKLTKGYNLPAKYVIHTVGPRFTNSNREELLRSAYRRSLEVAHQNGIKSLAFPSISTGVFGYPIEQASVVAIKTVKDFLDAHKEIEKVTFVLFSEGDLSVYKDNLNAV
ncbi:A1pp-domain-containing protein [Wallemia mellicola CBS 633.66]|uniref:A1pp-domain-containing protein n=1 Tax=Wallemia mellicola (strain ATCC MYA-4683 / CBS 633.66) TaxID=671144 RepID=I4YFU7_WALMC|nr:A1pp-domain-containing protein [Wallemia mellicola CBS 633.66]TIB93114.1 A1pp-domain-containing protein [Wallemia mellicola]EIM22839.1 A1pp-domain-containing protein [Wallemia mellicola CBS 633.66]TIC02211.1 A1pp-domain-containing protein [Wallemia mellicola]TIC18063.1 A1pp-domain-containing protein [Wallemia mellicola]TIC29168.1 A1pp-domain-containing protein [Wallemia mellicola]|eukprot:XP_006956891.1 A1pp-domain-containing protein [Wallemia mellicola CBS 633.66]